MSEEIRGFDKFRKFSISINIINKYFSYLRKKKRGDLSELLDRWEIEKHENTDMKIMEKLIRENLLIKDYLCAECYRVYDVIEDYYENLPFITLIRDTDSVFITLFCDSCRMEAMEKLLRREVVRFEKVPKWAKEVLLEEVEFLTKFLRSLDESDEGKIK